MGVGAIESLGVVCAAGARGSACPLNLPMLAMPTISSDYGQGNGQFYESCARFSGISKIRFYYDSNHCTGLELFYSFGGREVVGQIQGHYSYQFIVTNGKTIRRVHFTYEGNKLKNLSFRTEGTRDLLEKGYSVTDRTVCIKPYSIL